MRWQDAVDILLITFILYRLYVWLQGTRAMRILFALVGLGILYFLARLTGLFITTWILQYLWAVILVLTVVIFQSEIRQVLERMSPLRFFLGRPEALDRVSVEEVVRAAFDLAQKRIGALIVFQKKDILEDYLKGGIPLGGRLSYEVLSSIFLPDSPAHDGAVLIHGGKIVSVGCYLPLSDNPALPRNYGSRHRAGIGITERCDAVSLIVSEERGEVSLSEEGRSIRISTPEDLQKRLESILISPHQAKGRWQSALTTNLLPKGISFLAVFVIWTFIAGQQRAEMWLSVPLEYRNMPTNTETAGELVNRVEVDIRGPRGIISGLNPDQVRGHVNLVNAIPGTNYLRLTADNFSVPWGTEIIKINPSSVRIRLEEVLSRSIPVRVNLVQSLPPGLRLKRAEADPSSLVLRGSERDLNKVRTILTEPVDLSRIKENTRLPAGVEINSPHLRLAPNQPSMVSVEITVEK